MREQGIRGPRCSRRACQCHTSPAFQIDESVGALVAEETRAVAFLSDGGRTLSEAETHVVAAKSYLLVACPMKWKDDLDPAMGIGTQDA